VSVACFATTAAVVAAAAIGVGVGVGANDAIAAVNERRQQRPNPTQVLQQVDDFLIQAAGDENDAGELDGGNGDDGGGSDGRGVSSGAGGGASGPLQRLPIYYRFLCLDQVSAMTEDAMTTRFSLPMEFVIPF